MHPCLAEVSLDVVLPATLPVPLVMIAQTSVRNGADKRLRRFYHGALGKSKKRFFLQLKGKHGNGTESYERI
jgi:hypothetical protein